MVGKGRGGLFTPRRRRWVRAQPRPAFLLTLVTGLRGETVQESLSLWVRLQVWQTLRD